jgi:hypothetical protein
MSGAGCGRDKSLIAFLQCFFSRQPRESIKNEFIAVEITLQVTLHIEANVICIEAILIFIYLLNSTIKMKKCTFTATIESEMKRQENYRGGRKFKNLKI